MPRQCRIHPSQCCSTWHCCSNPEGEACWYVPTHRFKLRYRKRKTASMNSFESKFDVKISSKTRSNSLLQNTLTYALVQLVLIVVLDAHAGEWIKYHLLDLVQNLRRRPSVIYFWFQYVKKIDERVKSCKLVAQYENVQVNFKFDSNVLAISVSMLPVEFSLAGLTVLR